MTRGEAFGDQLLDDAGIIGELFVMANEHSYLIVIDANITFHHILWNLVIALDIVIQEVQDHDGVVHGCLTV